MTLDASIDRLAQRVRPEGRVAGYQTWTDLSFIHWRVPATELRPLLPAHVEIDEFDGSAWLGVVPFHMSGVRPWWFPALSGVSEFHETNVRTYVIVNGEPGVWFFSLDAANSLAVRIARWRWRLNYFRAEMELAHRDDAIEYHSRRQWPTSAPAHTDITIEVGDWLPTGQPQGEALPNTLEFFLVERYLLFTELSPSQIARGQVHHRPYPLKTAKLLRCVQSLTNAAGINVIDPPAHTLFSPGVEVNIFPLRAQR